MSTLGDIRPVSARDNVANSFHVYALDVKTGIVTGLTANSVVTTDGSSNLTTKTLTNGQLVIGSTGAAPVAASLTAGTGINITNGAGSITVSAPTLSLTPNSVVVTDGSGNLTTKTLTDGQLIIGSTGAAPAADTIIPGVGISVGTGAGTTTVNSIVAQTLTPYTPVLAFGGGSTGITYGIQVGKYQIIGSVCYFNAIIALTNKGSSTGVATVTLPVAPGASAFSTCGIVPWCSTITSTGIVQCEGQVGTAQLNFTQLNPSTGALTTLLDTSFANTSALHITGFYFIA